jgi:rhodanese-related sulfurtransferase
MQSKNNFQRRNVGFCKYFFLSSFSALILVATVIFPLITNVYATEKTIVRWIGIEKLRKIIEEQNPVIIDLRTPMEYAHGRIPGSVNIPIEKLRADRAALDLYKEKPVLLYCRTLNKTDTALWLLDERGFKTIYALRGGYEAYRMKN